MKGIRNICTAEQCGGLEEIIFSVRKQDGTWCSFSPDMERMACSYFEEVYTKDPTISPGEVIGCIDTKVTPDMNDSLCAPFTERKFQMLYFRLGH